MHDHRCRQGKLGSSGTAHRQCCRTSVSRRRASRPAQGSRPIIVLTITPLPAGIALSLLPPDCGQEVTF